MTYKTHFEVPKSGRIACSIGRFNHTHQIRNWSQDVSEVTCKQCLAQISKWANLNIDVYTKGTITTHRSVPELAVYPPAETQATKR